MKIGRNEPCYCGSGVKYKKCHGAIVSSGFKNSLIIHSPSNPEENISLGGPGMIMYSSVLSHGPMQKIQASPEKYTAVLVADLSVFYPLKNYEMFESTFEGREFSAFHLVKNRGEERFSTTRTENLPQFSNIQIQIKLRDLEKDVTGDGNLLFRLLINICRKLDSLLPSSSQLKLSHESHISYQVHYVEGDTKPDSIPVATSTFPYTGTLAIQTSDTITPVSNEIITSFFAEKFNIENFYSEKVWNEIKDKDFSNKISSMIFEFGYYCKQHAEVVMHMYEEHVRDLMIVLAKVIFKSAEAECFHYDGKLDFKISNIQDFQDFVTGELKWWGGLASLEELYIQGTQKHFTGQESDIYLIVLSRQKDFSSVYKQCKDYTNSQKNLILNGEKDSAAVKVISYLLENERSTHQPRLHLYVFDCYHEKVKV